MQLHSLGDLFRALKSNEPYLERYERIITAYYWLVDHHCGQWSWEYAAQCRLMRVYEPGPTMWVDSEDNELIQVAYNGLCDAENCQHERLTYGEGD
jgi:hypothetical protein